MKNESAFPLSSQRVSELKMANTTSLDGLTKREWFAGLIMQGQFANAEIIKEVSKFYREPEAFADRLAKMARHSADALIAELERKEE